MQSSAEGLTLSVPAAAPDPVSSTIVLQVQRRRWTSNRPAWRRTTTARSFCPPAKPACTASDIKYETGDQRDNLGFWTNPADWADWEFKVTRPGKFEVTAEIAALEKASLEVSVGDSTTSGTAAATGDYGKFKVAKLGMIEIPSPGKATLAVRPVKEGWHPLNLKAIRLKPVAAAQ